MTSMQEEANRLLEYRDGKLFWKIPRRGVNKNSDGDYPVGWVNGGGYAKMKIFGKSYYVHRIVFLMHYGYMPEIVDHIDRDTSNNRIENLRPANKSLNGCNSKIRATNTSGHTGVTWGKNCKKWLARVQIRGKNIHLGVFEDFDLACLVADEGRALYHGKYARV